MYPDFYALIFPKGFEKRGALIPHRSPESKGGGRANPRRAGEDAPVWQAFVLGRSRYRVEKKSLPFAARRGVRLARSLIEDAKSSRRRKRVRPGPRRREEGCDCGCWMRIWSECRYRSSEKKKEDVEWRRRSASEVEIEKPSAQGILFQETKPDLLYCVARMTI